jgi:hypothetical protein
MRPTSPKSQGEACHEIAPATRAREFVNSLPHFLILRKFKSLAKPLAASHEAAAIPCWSVYGQVPESCCTLESRAVSVSHKTSGQGRKRSQGLAAVNKNGVKTVCYNQGQEYGGV